MSGEQGILSIERVGEWSGRGAGENKPAEGIVGRPPGTWESGLRLAYFLGAVELVRAFRARYDQKKALEERVWPW